MFKIISQETCCNQIMVIPLRCRATLFIICSDDDSKAPNTSAAIRRTVKYIMLTYLRFLSFQVPALNGASASFWIVTDTLGQIPIEVSARSALAADAISIPLLVMV